MGIPVFIHDDAGGGVGSVDHAQALFDFTLGNNLFDFWSDINNFLFLGGVDEECFHSGRCDNILFIAWSADLELSITIP